MPSIEFWAATFELIGTLLIALSALLVHLKVSKEKAIDRGVIQEINLERYAAIFGIVFLLVGYLFHLKLFNTV